MLYILSHLLIYYPPVTEIAFSARCILPLVLCYLLFSQLVSSAPHMIFSVRHFRHHLICTDLLMRFSHLRLYVRCMAARTVAALPRIVAYLRWSVIYLIGSAMLLLFYVLRFAALPRSSLLATPLTDSLLLSHMCCLFCTFCLLHFDAHMLNPELFSARLFSSLLLLDHRLCAYRSISFSASPSSS